jgi:hypothetical protein
LVADAEWRYLENEVLIRILDYRQDEAKREWRKLNNEGLLVFHSTSDIKNTFCE